MALEECSTTKSGGSLSESVYPNAWKQEPDSLEHRPTPVEAHSATTCYSARRCEDVTGRSSGPVHRLAGMFLLGSSRFRASYEYLEKFGGFSSTSTESLGNVIVIRLRLVHEPWHGPL